MSPFVHFSHKHSDSRYSNAPEFILILWNRPQMIWSLRLVSISKGSIIEIPHWFAVYSKCPHLYNLTTNIQIRIILKWHGGRINHSPIWSILLLKITHSYWDLKLGQVIVLRISDKIVLHELKTRMLSHHGRIPSGIFGVRIAVSLNTRILFIYLVTPYSRPDLQLIRRWLIFTLPDRFTSLTDGPTGGFSFYQYGGHTVRSAWPGSMTAWSLPWLIPDGRALSLLWV